MKTCAMRNHCAAIFLLGFVLTVHGQGPGPGEASNESVSRPVDTRVQFDILEEQPIGTFVGKVPIKPGFTYRFNENLREFRLNSTTGEIVTNIVLDREAFESEKFDLVILSSQPTYPIEVRITLLDLNDNAPAFPEQSIEVSFSENANAGTRVILDTATDTDSGDNSVTTNYEIVSGNEDGKFRLAVTTNPSGETPYLHLETTGLLDRETVPYYQLNISAQDGGVPPLYGYLLLNISILDVNDNPPIFDHSDYVVSLNESVPIGTTVLQVVATDNDAGENARITYFIAETETQFSVDPETGVVATVEPLKCQQNCPDQHCSKSCVFTIFARDHGIPRQVGRTYITVNLLDANDHDPIIRFRYFPSTAEFATVDENAQNGSVVAAVSVIDFDEGSNGETVVEIKTGNELRHFRLEPTPSFHIVRVNGTLDREKLNKYNLTIAATDKGSPPRSTTAFLIISVNDVNDHEPVFEKSEYITVLSELAPIGSYVAGITATDEDTGINSDIFYSILSGDDYNWFQIDQNTGLVTTISELDRELRDSLELKISARDGGPSPRWAYASLRITLLDENDEKPSFTNGELNISLSENTQPNTIVAVLSATDPDQGTNGTISYHFDPEMEQVYPGIFSIDSSSGQIMTRTKLDREITPEFEIRVIAKDQGVPSQSSTATVYLKVVDANDNSPEFYPVYYFVNVFDSATIGEDIVRVIAVDEDEGINAQISYSIKSGSDGVFEINETTGIIRLKSTASLGSKLIYKLKIGAKDKGDRKAVEDALVEVAIGNMNIIAFTESQYNFTIKEDSSEKDPSIGREVGRIVTDASHQTGILKYSIVNGDPARLFQIKDSSGLITTAKRVDREQGPFYELTILARSGSSYATVKAYVTVGDLNDNPPKFSISRAIVHIPEDIPPGHEVYLAQAFDADENSNGLITYALSMNPQEIFRISKSSGMIYLRKPINQKEQGASKSLTIEVIATDNGQPPLSSRQIVQVIIDDVNDHTPVFEFSSYETSLQENVPLNDRFFSLSATDEDEGENGMINYEISDGNDFDKFGIFPDGFIYVRRALDREVQDYYVLTITARDGGSPQRSSCVTLVIHILDENDNPPVFKNQTFYFYLPENELPDTYIGRVTATDRDVGRNAELTFSVTNNQNDFAIDSRSGFVRTLQLFDREKVLQTTGQEHIVLDVVVNDNGVTRLRDRAKIYVYITDVNDNPPVFTRNPYKTQISEATMVDSPVFRVLAKDADENMNGVVTYSISSGDDTSTFRVDRMTGQVYLNKPLDREKITKYLLTITAQDLGESLSLSASTTLSIEVLDENDNAPLFKESINEISVSEKTPSGTKLFQFYATDSDDGINSEILFGIGAGNLHDTFTIESKSGILYLEKTIDYEAHRSYTLNITVSDSGSPKLATTKLFTIVVLDSNDNAPTFPSTAIVRQIQEGISVGTPIVTVNAEDPDSGNNSKTVYSIIQKEPSPSARNPPCFSIRPETGVIYTTHPIDREFADTFRLLVTATDQPSPPETPMSSEKLVTIIVEDVNDNSPFFTSVSAAILHKNTEAGAKIMTITATDADANTNGFVTYQILSGNKELFALDRSSGVLSTRKSVHVPDSFYKLVIRASDEAVQSQRRFTDLLATVIGVNNDTNVPVFSRALYTGTVTENEPTGTSVLTVVARLPEGLVQDVDYYIINSTSSKGVAVSYFEVDSKTGTVTTRAPLDRESGIIEYEIELAAASVGGGVTQVGFCKARIKVLDKNDSPPVFEDVPSVITVSEELLPGEAIVKFTASDLDTQGSISYSLLNDIDKKFTLDSTSGILSLKDTLDREEKAGYKIIIRADDSIQQTDVEVLVQVSDANDNAPVFTEVAYSFDIPEDATRGSVVGIVTANDADEGINGQVSYTVLSDWGNDIFSLNPQTGIFTLTSRLDYEQTQHYIFVVQAQDTGRPSLFSTVTVYFNVLDLNDNSPVFDPMGYNDEVFENITVGTTLLRVSATDQDSGNNGKLEFKITGGDEEKHFGIDANGTLFTVKELDREEQSAFNLIVTAIDMAELPQKRLSSTVQVTITLKDVNDMAPEFVTPNITTVAENAPVNSVVMAIKAIDRDEGRNSYIEYSLAPVPDGRFVLGPVDGLLRVAAQLDRETRANYTLYITAHDRGIPSQSVTQEIFIRILDDNDNSPIFDPKQYSASVSENASVGLSILQVSATDADEELNGRVRYSIVAGDANRDFAISEDTGIVRVAKSLNYERKNHYVITVQAEDSGTYVRYDSSTVTVTLIDVNDNAPIFLNSPYIAYVMENAESLPLSVVTVQAFDADSYPFNKVRYLLKDGDSNLFKINTTSGEVTVHKALDREAKQQYQLSVIALDGGTPGLTGTGTVIINVKDINDHAPEFVQSFYQANVEENTPVGSSVMQVSAVDPDDGLNSLVRYSLVGNHAAFKIDPETGIVSTHASLDRETVTTYNLLVMATDSNPANMLSATASLVISVSDVNDNVPAFSSSSNTVVLSNNLPIGSFVFGAKAQDLDIGNNGRVTYHLSGDDADKFQIDQSNGVIKTATLLPNDKSFSLEIRATDNGVERLSSTTDLVVNLRKTANFPVISKADSMFKISEEVHNKGLTRFSASSPKSGKAGEIKYYIAGGDVGDVFAINKKTGELKVDQGLDFETFPQYELWVEARDSDDPPLGSFTSVIVNVTDANDNAPVFERSIYNATILEEQTPPQLLITVRASDLDSGRNSEVSYRLRSKGSATETFYLEENTGKVFTKAKLDREEAAHYTLVIEAIDQGEPSKTGTATVLVNVADKNDNPPRFTRLFSVNVTENAPIGTFVIQVTSSDRDIGSNANATYSFSENPNGKFRIDPISGNVTVAGLIDRETKEEYVLKVTAIDGSWRAETPLTITVQDQNDNNPEFEHSFYSFNFPELQRNVAFVGQVTAIDRDKSGPNSMVSYSLKLPSDFFSIDPTSGEIFSKQIVRYKHSRRGPSPENIYSFIVVASDRGKPPLASECLVNVNIVDANNNAPVFETNSYFSPVPDAAIIGQNIIQVRATDIKDYGVNAQIEYAIIAGNGSDFFTINEENGWLSVASPLFGRRELEFVLQVRAMDRGVPPQSDETVVFLVITGENNYTPTFSALSYQVIVPENEPVGSVIVTVTASDQDIGPNGMIRYSILQHEPGNHFAIDPTTGSISVANQLDYDTVQKYVLNVTASDLGFVARKATAVVTVLLIDVNDNPPKFEKQIYEGTIAENSPPGTHVFKLQAIDIDSARNAIIQYSIIGGNGKDSFSVDPKTGQIVSKVSFDFEEKNLFLLDIIATNPDSSMFGSTRVQIRVTGVNEFFPKFVQPVFHFTVSESAPLGSIAGTVQALDKDGGDDGIVYYLFVGSSNEKGFHISPETGVISVARHLDRESQSRVVLTVLAKNSGGIRGNDTDEAQVVISIQDGNDPPVFLQPHYEVSVYENASIGSSIVAVTAVDKDIRAPNNQFSYTILHGNANGTFKIDPQTGMVETTSRLDRELEANFNITIAAIDNGIPQQTGLATVHVSVKDVNDNGPYFEGGMPIGYVSENEPSGTSVTVLSASDPDLPPNGGPFKYTVVGGDHRNIFTVDRDTGFVRTTKPIDREVFSEILLEVEVIDSGNPPMRSVHPVKVIVQDKNDNPSTPRALQILVNNYSNEKFKGRVADVPPNDVDLVGNYQCRILNGETSSFSIQNSCTLYASKISSPGNYSFKISGNDGVHPDVVSTVSVAFNFFSNKTLNFAVPIRIYNKTGENFLSTYWRPLKNLLQNIFKEKGEPQIFSINSQESHLDISVVVKISEKGYLAKEEVYNVLMTNKDRFYNLFDVHGIAFNFTPCQESPCLNGGKCTAAYHIYDSSEITSSTSLVLNTPMVKNEYSCSCRFGFSGQKCDLRQDPCSPNPCENGGSCTKSGKDFKCICTAVYHGRTCDTVKPKICEANPCKNGGTCQETRDGGFFCLCRNGFRGLGCEITSDSCRPNPCMNGGSCLNLKPGYKCQCLDNFYGSFCEKSSFGFEELSYMAFPSLEASTNDISIVFSTNKPDALLMYNFGHQNGGRSDFVALEIYEGRPWFLFGSIQTATASLFVEKEVTDGRWYRITATRNGRVGSLTVADCTNSGEMCTECKPGDKSCSTSYTGFSGTLNFNGQPLYIGGIPSIEPILERPLQVHNDDFIGCIQSVSVNGRPLDMTRPTSLQGISNTCQRISEPCKALGAACGSSDDCIDKWNSISCQCSSGVFAPNCNTALQPLTLDNQSYLEFKVSEKFKRRILQKPGGFTSRARSIRDDTEKSISVTFRTFTKEGCLIYAETNTDYTALTIKEGFIQYTSHSGIQLDINMTIPERFVSDGAWHNLTVVCKHKSLFIVLDDVLVGEELDLNSLHDILDPYLTLLTIGGAPEERFTRYESGFEGCIANVTVNNEIQPINGSGGYFKEVIVHGKAMFGCNGAAALGTSSAPDPLSIGITLVVVFFSTLLVGISISFIVFRLRRQRRDQKGFQGHGKSKGVAILGRAPPESTRAHPEGGYADNNDYTDEIMRPSVNQDISTRKIRDGELTIERGQRPDIIEREVVNSSPGVNMRLEDSVSTLGQMIDSEAPEHYDLENASSIAPSDIDIVYHYKGYRDAGMRNKYKLPSHVTNYHKHNHRHSPHNFPSQIHRESPRNMLRASPAQGLSGSTLPVTSNRESPHTLKMQSTPLARLSPSSELSTQMPRILTLQDISGKPLQTALLATAQANAAVKDVTSQSERSLNSPVSQMSHSSGSLQTSVLKDKRTVKKGSVRLANSNSLISAMDAVSSSSDERPRMNQKLNDLMETNTDLLEANDSSTDESGNDSFTCSEFEYENNYEKVNRDNFRQENMIFSKLSEADNENDQDNESTKRFDGFESFRGSLSTLIASDDDFGPYKHNDGDPLSWSYLLNWGPNFDSLVGVFKDIAELSDTNSERRTPRQSNSGKLNEEYV
ncbi:cadherin-related tumor suppressor-like [Artemia franciscana]|uniref:Protocadherin-16 n=1 Tax=Artemia franciscana TaxID=6661 RepID=A0AA88IRP9_ARTSF|nr:hypothetical protein QYM36_000160 [Artemia franciscana]